MSHHRGKPRALEPLEALAVTAAKRTHEQAASGAAPDRISRGEPTETAPLIVDLKGGAEGTFHSHLRNVNSSTDYRLEATAQFAALGQARLIGTLHSTGFVARGRAFGTLELHFADGIITLALTGPTQQGLAPLPSQLAYVIAHATGQFGDQAAGRGTVNLSLNSSGSRAAGKGTGRVRMGF